MYHLKKRKHFSSVRERSQKLALGDKLILVLVGFYLWTQAYNAVGWQVRKMHAVWREQKLAYIMKKAVIAALEP